MKIRKASIEDFEEILELEFEFFNEDFRFDRTFDANIAYSEKDRRKLKNCIEMSDCFVYVAEDKDSLVGFILGYLQNKREARKNVQVAMINYIYVKEKFRGQGIGKNFLKLFEKWAKNQRANKLKVGSFYENEAVKRLYKNLGFKEWYVELEKDI